MGAEGRAGGGQGVPGPNPSVLAALERMTQQPKQRQRREESAEGGRRVEGGEHREEEKTKGRAGSTSLTSGRPGGRCTVGGAAGRGGPRNPCSPFFG